MWCREKALLVLLDTLIWAPWSIFSCSFFGRLGYWWWRGVNHLYLSFLNSASNFPTSSWIPFHLVNKANIMRKRSDIVYREQNTRLVDTPSLYLPTIFSWFNSYGGISLVPCMFVSLINVHSAWSKLCGLLIWDHLSHGRWFLEAHLKGFLKAILRFFGQHHCPWRRSIWKIKLHQVICFQLALTYKGK